MSFFLQELLWSGGTLSIGDLGDGAFRAQEHHANADTDGQNFRGRTVDLPEFGGGPIGVAMEVARIVFAVYGGMKTLVELAHDVGFPLPGEAGPNASEMDNGGTSYGIGTWNTFGALGGDTY